MKKIYASLIALHIYLQDATLYSLLRFVFLFIQLKKKTLEVTVWDYDKSSSNDFLGEVSSLIYNSFKI